MDSFTALLLVAACGLALAMPAVDNQRDLSAVMNRTVCPIVMEMDVDLKRIPQRIKVLKCGPRPLEHCEALGVPAHECCQLRRDGAALACAEVEDLVEVHYPASGLSQPYRVSVGCACVIDEPVLVQELSP